MLRKNSIFVLVAVLINTSLLYSDHWGRLNGITNKSSYKVTVQTSDSQGEVVLTNRSKPKIQNVEFDVKSIKSMNLVVPENEWDGDAAIHVRVYKNGAIISQADITDRNGRIYVHDRNNNIDIITIDKYYCASRDDRNRCNFKERSGGDEYFKLAVDQQGNIILKDIEQKSQ